MNKQYIGVLGATSLVGECLLRQVAEKDYLVAAFSRSKSPQVARKNAAKITWHQLKSYAKAETTSVSGKITWWITVAPIWTLSEHFDLLLAYGVKRIVVLSSTSRFTKDNSSDPGEQAMARRLIDGEDCLQRWAAANKVEWIILRPTLIYGFGRDKNISEIASFIGRFGCFPLLGSAKGLRQPVHAEDVAMACLSALTTADIVNRDYNLAGGETISYHEMVRQVIIALENKGVIKHKCLADRWRLLTVPRWVFKLAVTGLRWIPRYRHWTTEMADRMNHDLVFDYSDAKQDFSFSPRLFKLSSTDLS